MGEQSVSRRTIIGAGVAGSAAAVSSLAFAQGAPQPGALTTAPTSQSGLSPRLTMHAIDTFHGTPGAGMRCDLSVLDGDAYRPIKSFKTAESGRTAEPLLVDEAFKPGRYELLMHFGEYFATWKAQLPTPSFLTTVPIRFVIADATQRYHLPVLFTPWGYSYYRGS